MLPSIPFLSKLVFSTLTDHSIFIFHQGQSIIIVPMYINDKLLAGNDKQLLDSIQNSISTHFKSSDLSVMSWILGICIHHNIDAGTLFIEQSQYIKSILSQYGMLGCMPVSIPLPANSHFHPALPDNHAEFSSSPYLELLRSLIYPPTVPSPDITF